MKQQEYSGALLCTGDSLVYHSTQTEWSIPISEIRVIGEFTNSGGPHLDDYFFVFLTASEGGWHQASFYAKGREQAFRALEEKLGASLEAGLCDSTEYKTRILWPPYLLNQPLMEILPPKSQTTWQKISNCGSREIRLSEAASRVFSP